MINNNERMINIYTTYIFNSIDTLPLFYLVEILVKSEILSENFQKYLGKLSCEYF